MGDKHQRKKTIVGQVFDFKILIELESIKNCLQESLKFGLCIFEFLIIIKVQVLETNDEWV
jgi:hypothetical protein